MAAADVIVRLDVEGMKHQILHAFSERALELTDLIDVELTKAIENFDFGAEIRKTVYEELPKLVDEAVQSAMRRAIYASEVQETISAAVVAGMQRSES